MKRVLCLGLLMVLAVLPAFGIAAQTTLVASVPDRHTIIVHCVGQGAVGVDGKTMSGSFSVSVPRFGLLSLNVTPESGWHFSGISGAVHGAVYVRDNAVSVERICGDMELTIAFAERNESPVYEAAGNPVWKTPVHWLGGYGLAIVLDELDVPQSYELIPIPDEAEGHTLYIEADPDENDEPQPRRLVLHASKLRNMYWHGVRQLYFVNGSVCIRMRIEDLLAICTARAQELNMPLSAMELDAHLMPDGKAYVCNRELPEIALWANRDRFVITDELPMLDESVYLYCAEEKYDAAANEIPFRKTAGKADSAEYYHVVMVEGKIDSVEYKEHVSLAAWRRRYVGLKTVVE